jgi:Right handed beta helix region
MNKFRFTINALTVLVFTLAFASLAQAQVLRTWVSGVGDDVNPCSRTAPCKTFAGAISKTAAGGEIDALDPGGFGAVTINKAMTLDGGGGQVASILAAGTNGINIVAGGSDIITLNNLRLMGVKQTATPGLDAIKITSAAGVHVMNCIIENWSSNGIEDVRAALSFLEVNNTSITNCGLSGISVSPGAGINVHIANSRLQNNGSSGFSAGTSVTAVVFNSVVSQNIAAGILANSAGGATSVSVDHSVVSSNVNGFQANSASSTILVSNTTAVGNLTLAATAGGGHISSYGNNQTGGVAFPLPNTGQN